MTKKEALAYFNRYIKPSVIERYGENDKPAMRQEWGFYTDSLCREGRITLKQYETWDNPF